MKFKYLILFIFIFACAENAKLINKEKIDLKKAFISKGFTLIYEDRLYKEREQDPTFGVYDAVSSSSHQIGHS